MTNDVEREEDQRERSSEMLKRKSGRLLDMVQTPSQPLLFPRDPATLISEKLGCSAHVGTSLGNAIRIILDAIAVAERIHLRSRKPRPQIVVATNLVAMRDFALSKPSTYAQIDESSLFLRHYTWKLNKLRVNIGRAIE
ncbi:hypothetical protein EAG_00586 [Camponotus floridanus]|uniref:Uncharacterized protein n=1 Tax=Camponotus floridanus TaxID=104421 RepID=E2A4B1_CAMFO|nr:hypothetical protein EAG_00586 [Camponotus floridanus]